MSDLSAALSGPEPHAASDALDYFADAAAWVARLAIVGVVLVTGAIVPLVVGLVVYRLVSRAVSRWVG